MFKLVRFVYEAGRRQGYSEVIGELEGLSVKLPAIREGQKVREVIDDRVKIIKEKLKEEATK